MLKSLASAIFFAGLSAVLLAMIPRALQTAPSELTRAEMEEQLLFEDPQAQWFGQPALLETQLQLLATELGSGSNQSAEEGDGLASARMAIDGTMRRVNEGDILFPPCLRLAAIYPQAALLEDCGAYNLLTALTDSPVAIMVSGSGQLSNVAPHVHDYRGDRRVRELAQDYWERLYRRPLSLRGRMRIDVAEVLGGKRRYQIYPGDDPRPFQLTALRSGDVLSAVNGVSLDGSEALTTLYRELSESTSLTLTVQREDRDIVLLIDL